jgi:hypothetical protein
MEFFRRRSTLAETPVSPESTLGSADTLPATVNTTGARLKAGGQAAWNKANRIYHENPKLIGGLAVLAGALLLNRMRRHP